MPEVYSIEELFKLDELEAGIVEDTHLEFISKALKESGIELTQLAALDILFQDELMLAHAFNTRNACMIYLAVDRLRQLRILNGTSEQWYKFSERCLFYVFKYLPH